MKNRRIEAIVFDMDGLLFDSERIVQRSWEEAGQKLGIPQMGSHIYHTLGMNVVSRRAYFAREIDPDFPQEAFASEAKESFWRIVEEEGLAMKPGARELLEYGRSHGYRMALATSSRKEYALGNLKNAGIREYFDEIVAGDMVSHAKPDPEIYLTACAALGVEPVKCLALEDAPAGVRAAHGAGMQTIVIPDLLRPSQEIRSLVWKCCETLEDVIELLEEN